MPRTSCARTCSSARRRRLKVDAAKLQIRDGVISSTDDPKKKITFAELVKANKGPIRMAGSCAHPTSIGRAMNRGVGACFAEVEVDTWTGDWRYVKAAYCHDAGHVMNPLLANADQHGSLVQSIGDDHRRDSVGPGISGHAALRRGLFVLPDADDHGAAGPDQRLHQQPGAALVLRVQGLRGDGDRRPPGALANAIYNACGVRIREHPITKDAIMAGLRAKERGVIA